MAKKKNENLDNESLEIIVQNDNEISAKEILTESNTEQEIAPEDSVTLLKQKIETLPLEEDLVPQVSSKIDDSQDLEDEEKIQYVLKLAQTKGVIFAVKVAQKMDNPYILDAVHDALIEQGYYRKFENSQS